MISLALIFLSQFSIVFLLGFQSQNIRDDRAKMAALTSLCIGGFQAFQWKVMPRADALEIAVWTAAGPIAIVCAMKFYGRWFAKRR